MNNKKLFPFIIILFFSIFSRNTIANDKAYVCIAYKIDNQDISTRSAIAQRGLFTPTLTINNLEANIFISKDYIALDLRKKPEFTLTYSDFIKDGYSKIVNLEHDRYRKKIAKTGDIIDLFVFTDNEKLMLKNNGLHPIMIIYSKPNGQNKKVFYDCYNEIKAYKELELKFIK